MIKGAKMINQLFKKFGMEMHVGQNKKESKTDVHPNPSFLQRHPIANPR